MTDKKDTTTEQVAENAQEKPHALETKDLHTPDNEALYEFPCEFELKAMGKNSEDFIDTVYQITEKHVPSLERSAVRVKDSKGKKFISVNVKFTATSLKQLHAIYADLKQHPDVLMTL
jgi:putative lipoic acid-binding regulatory protein